MINRAVLNGRLTRDPEIRQTQSGLATASFTLAVDRSFKDKQTGKREADFINCVAWRKTAEILQQYTHKGSRIGLTGRIQTRNYQNKQGQTVYVTEVVADEIDLLDPSEGAGTRNNYSSTNTPSQNLNVTQGQNLANNDPFQGTGNTVNIDNTDLPF